MIIKHNIKTAVSMNIGSMRNKIDIICKEKKKDTDGYKVKGEIDVPFKRVWANISNLYGKDFWSAKTANLENTVIFTIRYSKDLEQLNPKKHKIKFKNRYFDIIHIDNVLYKNDVIKIKAIEVI